jgi:hypothetical protein
MVARAGAGRGLRAHRNSRRAGRQCSGRGWAADMAREASRARAGWGFSPPLFTAIQSVKGQVGILFLIITS